MKRVMMAVVRAALLAAFAAVLPALAQVGTTGSITGLVSDGSGAAIPGARVVARNQSTGVEYAGDSSSTGNYAIVNLPIGAYRVSVSITGFKTWTRPAVPVASNETVRVDVAMEVGQISEKVEVSASASPLQTETTQVSSAMERKLVETLPVPVGQVQGIRTPLSLAIMLPEVRTETGEGGGNTPSMRIGGGQALGWSVNVDGQRIETGWRNLLSEQRLLTPPVDALEEFRVDSGSYRASDSQSSGGSVTLVTKAGTNEYHGSVFNFYQSQRFNANSWLNNRLGRRKNVFHRNDFGVTSGGPVRIPKLYDGRNRSFVFLAYEGYRFPQTIGPTQNTVPTRLMRTGNFTEWVDNAGRLVPIYDPATTRLAANGSYVRDPFPGNVIPGGRISPISRTIASYYPDPNAPGLVRNYDGLGSAFNKRVEHIFSTRGDHSFGNANRLAVTYTQARKRGETSWDRDPANPRSWPTLPYPLGSQNKNDIPERGDVVRLNDTHILRPNLVNTLTLGFHQFQTDRSDVSVGAEPWSRVIGGVRNGADPDAHFPTIQFATDNYTGTNSHFLITRQTRVYGLDNSLSWIKRNHNVQFGYSFNLMRYNNDTRNFAAGTFTFHRLGTSVPADNSARSGSAFASFLLGQVQNGSVNTRDVALLIYPYHALFVQDDWKVTPRLTVNLGLRFELSRPAREAADRGSYFDPTLPNPAADGRPGALRFVGSGPGRDGSRSFYPATRTWGPRAGIAYRIGSNTVVRMGAGLYYAPNKFQMNTLGFSANPSWASVNQGVTPAFDWDDGFPDWQRPPFIDPTLSTGLGMSWAHIDNLGKAPSNASWNVAVSRALPGNFVVDLNYAGNKGTHLSTNRLNYMQIDPRYASLGNLLNRPIDDPGVRALGFTSPFPSFRTLMGTRATLGQSLRLFPHYNNVGNAEMSDLTGNSTYHALMARVSKRYSNGLSLMVSYVWSKTLTDADATAPGVANNFGAGIGAGPAQNHFDRRAEKSYSNTDLPHVFKTTASYDLPFGKGRAWARSGVASALAGGWNLAGYIVAQSGYPLGVLDTAFPNFLNSGPARPDIRTDQFRAPIAGAEFDPDRDLLLDAGAFARRTNPAIAPFGNAARFYGSVRWGQVVRENVTLQKRFDLFRERLGMTLRWEIYNLFNHKTWDDPVSLDLSNPQFGRVANAAGVRTMQVGAKLQW